MLPRWTGSVVGWMHIYGITLTELAKEADRNPKYVSTVLNAEMPPAKARKAIVAALERLVKKKEEEEKAENDWLSLTFKTPEEHFDEEVKSEQQNN